MDINEEEKERGKTVEMGRAGFDTVNKRFTVFDCPGHRNYVQNMISGAAQADVAGLVISAKPGEFEAGFEKDGQTREHAMLAKSLGAQYLIVIINKMDTVEWNEERFNYIQTSLHPFLTKNCGYNAQNIFYVAISAQTGLNMKESLKPELAPWYKGKSLWQTLDGLPPILRSHEKILRIPLLDKFKEKGVLTTSGKIGSGVVKPNMQCVLMPLQKPITISRVLDVDDNEMAYAGVGDNVTLQIKGIEEEEIRRGYVICGLQFWTNVCEEFEADVQVFELPSNQFFGPGFLVVLHMHTILEEATIVSVTKIQTTAEGEEKKVNAQGLRSGERGVVRIKVKSPVCLEKYAEFPELGRFALRKETITVASGTVTRFKPLNPELLKNNNYFAQTNASAKN